MTKEEIRDWVRRKLDEGVEEQKIRQVLSRKGQDPSIVDEVRNSSRSEPEKETEWQPTGIHDDSASRQKEGNHGFEKGQENWKYVMGLLFLSTVVVVGFIHVPEVDLSRSSAIQEPDTDNSSNQQDQIQVPENTTRVTISNSVAKPSRPVISSNESILFVNNADHGFNITFDRAAESFVLPRGQSETVDVDLSVYYTAKPINSDAGAVKGSIGVE